MGEPGRAVFALEAHRQRVDPGPQRSHLAFGAALGGLQFGDPLVGQPQRRHRPVVVLVEADFALVELTDPALHGFELDLGLLGARGGFFDALGQLGHTVVDRLDPRPHRLHLAGQPGQTLAAVGLGLHRRQRAPVRLRRRRAHGRPARHGRRQAGCGHAASSASSCCSAAATCWASASNASGSGPPVVTGLDVQMLRPLAGDPHGRAHPFGQRGQPKPGLLR